MNKNFKNIKKKIDELKRNTSKYEVLRITIRRHRTDKIILELNAPPFWRKRKRSGACTLKAATIIFTKNIKKVIREQKV